MPRIPSGAKTTNLAPTVNAARQQGFLTRLSSAVRYAIAGVTPDVWMSPNQPVTPVAQEVAGRQFDFPVGTNLFYTPRGTELTSFQQLRALADNCDLVRLAIETRKDQMAALNWAVAHVDPDKDVDTDPRAQAIDALFKRPDGVHGWQGWLRMLMEEVMVTDATSIYPRKLNNGQTCSFELIDGTTIKPLVDDGGRMPLAPSVAYQQVLKGIPAADYTADELLYYPRNPRVNKFYGYSPVEQIIVTINTALRRAVSQLQYFTEGNIPAAFASVPKDWQPDQIKAFQMYWDSVIEGDQAYKRKVRFVPGDTKVTNLRDAPLKDEFDEWIARVVMYCFSLPPTPFIRQMNRSTAGTQQEAALKEGLMPLMAWVKELMDCLIQKHLGFADLQFKWVEDEDLDPTSQATILTTYQKTGVYSINDVRAKLGEDPIDDGDKYLIFTGSGAMTLEEVLRPPPDPPVGVVAPAANADSKGAPAAPGAAKPAPDAKPAAKPAAEKHDHGHLHKDDSSLTPPMQTLRDSFGAALDVVRQAAVKQLGKLGKAAGADGADGTRDDNHLSPEDPWIAEFITELDTSGLTLAWDDYTDTLQAVAVDGSRQTVARLVAQDLVTAAEAHGFDALDHQDPNAIKWAAKHAGDMITSDGAGGELADATRDMVRQTITAALEDHATDDELATALNDAYAFSPQRAELIARTEVMNALGAGSLSGAKAVGMEQKDWLLSNDENKCALCIANAAEGWIPIDQAHVSGAMAPTQHPRCQCGQAYRRKPKED